MPAVDEFILEYDGPQREIMLLLHEWLTVDMGLRTKISYGIPFYYSKSWICYMNPTKNGTIEFAFPRGNELTNAQGILDSRGRKQVMGVEFTQVSDIPFELLEEVLREAIELDERTRYRSKRG